MPKYWLSFGDRHFQSHQLSRDIYFAENSKQCSPNAPIDPHPCDFTAAVYRQCMLPFLNQRKDSCQFLEKECAQYWLAA